MSDRLIKRVAVLPFPGIDGALVCVSGKKRPVKPEFDVGRIEAEPFMTFTFVRGEAPHRVAAEWEPKHGPIQIWYERQEGDHENDCMPHWLWPFGSKGNLRWSQCAVDENDLPERFIEGDYEGIFHVLAIWAEREWEPVELPATPSA
ncbi:hypothetical protein [Azospirillum sp.]|uniref:hypothetical protein n=1 Tax=Azospirillum sp. TaxID=34012 RepID=UPI003D718D00